jgi:transposase
MAAKENWNSAESLMRDIKRKTRRMFDAEEKILILIEGMHGEVCVAALCRFELLPTLAIQCILR